MAWCAQMDMMTRRDDLLIEVKAVEYLLCRL